MLEQQKIQENRTLEVSLADVVLFLKNYLKLLILAPIFFAILGVCFSFLMTRKFTAQTILLPEYNMGKSNSFFSMAMSMDKNGAEKLVPELYPNILSSTPFGQHLLTQPVMDENGTNYKTLREYFAKSRKPSFLSKLFSFSSSDEPTKKPVSAGPKDILMLSSQELNLVRSASALIQTTIDSKNGIITLSCEMADPVVASMLVEASKKYLVNYVEEYRTSKTEEQVQFLEDRVAEVKSRQQKAEYALQSYRDRNRNSFLNVARIEEQRLQSDFTVAQGVYSDLISRLEQARIRVKEEKPVFKVLEPAKVPVAKSSPKRIVIGFICGVAGGFFTLMYIIFFREKYHQRLLYGNI
ncbi:Wzz/FepE/Etk N-terminal domain-containing protein [Dyadobacter sp. CY323]|uniref:Wzz/FepE/Etk N-terminal domain-containing protein n=1 Tax=Dyadobacter sp. CY323 TaxID=2907302 RepID=UPI001F160889|nr:Wzz/FepE/Etk N-terminal domain-containing protein [Dyadobacter sp. CY323]MCE6990949.1 Wzz/FepE/Etk N-terminal domain-containing protein [Dyadobacter sp. CY323]